MTGTDGAEPDAPIVCLGEALVDLICPDPVGDPAEAGHFRVHSGGALANVAIAARRAGAPGGARRRLRRRRVGALPA